MRLDAFGGCDKVWSLKSVMAPMLDTKTLVPSFENENKSPRWRSLVTLACNDECYVQHEHMTLRICETVRL